MPGQDYDLNVDGVTYNLHWDKAVAPTQADIQSVVDTARANPGHQQAAFVAPKDPQTEQAVAAYSSKFLKPGHIPYDIAEKTARTPPDGRYGAIPQDLSDIGRIAVMRYAYGKSGYGAGESIHQAAAPAPPNALQKALTATGDVLSYTSAPVKALLQPLRNALLQAPEADAAITGLPHQKGYSPEDLATSAATAKQPFLQRLQTVRKQPLASLGTPHEAALKESLNEQDSPVGRSLYALGELGGNLVTDPLTYVAGGANALLESKPLLARLLSGAFATQQLAPLAANPGQIAQDPYRAVPQLLMGGLAGLHAATGPHAPAAPAAPGDASPLPPNTGGNSGPVITAEDIAKLQQGLGVDGPPAPNTGGDQAAFPSGGTDAPARSDAPLLLDANRTAPLAHLPDAARIQSDVFAPLEPIGPKLRAAVGKEPAAKAGDSGIPQAAVGPESPARDYTQKSSDQKAEPAADRAPFEYQPETLGQQYHGTSKPIETVGHTFDRYQGQNLFGPGFYTTDSSQIAGSYTKKGGGAAPSVYSVHWERSTPPRFLDLEKPLPPELHDLFGEYSEGLDLTQPAKDVYREFKDALAGDGVTRDEAEERLDNISHALQQEGYDGLAHVGGKVKGGPAHNVKIFFAPLDPHTDAANLSLRPFDGNAAPGQADGGGQAPTLQAKSGRRVQGALGETFTPKNTRVPIRYAVVPVEDLVTSHTDSFSEAPGYDQEMQDRDRGRTASVDQVGDIKGKLNFSRMAEAPGTDAGAPLVGQDLHVESGNGRSMALRQAYNEGLPQAAKYKQDLIANADKYGIAPSEITGIDRPALVRVSQMEHATPADRAAFAREAGQSTVAQRSAPEIAANDARSLRQAGALQLYDPTSAIGSKANLPFVRKFVEGIASTERGDLMTGEGNLSAAGAQRIRYAILRSAYDDPSTISRMVDDVNPDVKTIGNAMERVAPQVAMLREEIAKGHAYPGLDISGDITDAANRLAHLRRVGNTVDEELGQTSLMGKESDLSPEAKVLLRSFDENVRSGKRIGDVLQNYHDLARELGGPHQLESETRTLPTKLEMLQAAIKHQKDSHADVQPALFEEPAGSGELPAASSGAGTDPAAARDAGEAVRAPGGKSGAAEPAADSGKPGDQPGQVAETAGTYEVAAAPVRRKSLAKAARAEAPAGSHAAGGKPPPYEAGGVRLSGAQANSLGVHFPFDDPLGDRLSAAEPRGKAGITLSPSEVLRAREVLNQQPKSHRAGFPELYSGGEQALHAGLPLGPALRAVAGEEAARSVKEWKGNIRDEIHAVFDPASMDAASRQTANMGREHLARLAQKYDRALEVLGDLQKKFPTPDFEPLRKLSDSERADFVQNVRDGGAATSSELAALHDWLSFTHAIEVGGDQTTPELQAVADILRGVLQGREKLLIDRSLLHGTVENYLPHMWKDSKAAEETFAQAAARRPLTGPESYRKLRTIPTTADGIERGLEPVTTNPIELTRLKIYEIDKSIMGHDWFDELRQTGLPQFVRERIPPPGYTFINDKIAQAWRPAEARLIDENGKTLIRPVNGEDAVVTRNMPEGSEDIAGIFANDRGMIRAGQWAAPDNVARIINNHLAPGLAGSTLYRSLATINNALNMAQLGLSGFHATGVSINAVVSEVGRSIEKAGRGDIIGAGRALAGSPFAPVTKYLKGRQVLAAWKGQSAPTAALEMANALVQAGGRATLDPVFRLNSMEKFGQALRARNVRGAIWHAPFAALEATMSPLMRDFVPKIKLGVFADMAADELGRLQANYEKTGVEITNEDRRAALASAWDSVENRFGQIAYDNLFWHRTLKDSLHLGVRSVGWNLGTIRELGGGAIDTLTTGSRLQKGGPLVTRKMGFLGGLAFTTAVFGAVYQKLQTGKDPESLEDYFHPRTARGDRVSLPTYMKDVEGYGTEPLKTLSHKQSPLVGLFKEMAANEDFYGQPIRNANDPAIKQAEEYSRYLVGQLTPFSFRSKKGAQPAPGSEAWFESKLGVVPYYPKKKSKASGYR